jgi:hypothetical protein
MSMTKSSILLLQLLDLFFVQSLIVLRASSQRILGAQKEAFLPILNLGNR